MERRWHAATRLSPPKRSPDKVKGTSEGFQRTVHGSGSFSFKAFIRSFFACTGSGIEWGDEPAIYQDHATKKPVVSPTRPLDASKQRRRKHSAPKTPQVQQENLIALCTDLKQSEAVNARKDTAHNDVRKDVAHDDICKDMKHNASPDSAKENQETPPPLPNISEPSTILSESLRSSLCTLLPTLVRGREWVLLYSTWKHGISLRTLYRRSTHISGPYLLAVEDGKGVVFGGLLTGPLNPTTKPKFQGTHDSFVFTTASADFGVFRATGANRNYQICTNDMLGLGGGGTFALRLDGDFMHGSSGLSETFGNRCLSHSQEFSIRHVELWGFAHTSKYVPNKALYHPREDLPGICRY